MFAEAIEASANNPTPPINVSATFLTDHIAPQFCHAQFYTVETGALMPAGNCAAESVFLFWSSPALETSPEAAGIFGE